MVVVMASDGDPGEHAIDETATGSSEGFVLENGQVDEYMDRDTVPLGAALRLVASVVERGTPLSDVGWCADR